LETLKLRVGSGKTGSGYGISYFVLIKKPDSSSWESPREKVDWDWVSSKKTLGWITLNAKDYPENTIVRAYGFYRKGEPEIQYYVVQNNMFIPISHQEEIEEIEDYLEHKIMAKVEVTQYSKYVKCYYAMGVFASSIQPRFTVEEIREQIEKYMRKGSIIEVPREIVEFVQKYTPEWAEGLVLKPFSDAIPFAKSKFNANTYYYKTSWRKYPTKEINTIINNVSKPIAVFKDGKAYAIVLGSSRDYDTYMFIINPTT